MKSLSLNKKDKMIIIFSLLYWTLFYLTSYIFKL